MELHSGSAWLQRSVRGIAARYRVRGDSVGDAPVAEVSIPFALGALLQTIGGCVLPLETVMDRRFAVGGSQRPIATNVVALSSSLSFHEFDKPERSSKVNTTALSPRTRSSRPRCARWPSCR